MWTYDMLKNKKPELFSNNNAPYEIIEDSKQISSWQQQRRAKLASEGEPAEWADIGIVLNDPYVLVLRDLVRTSSGKITGYIRLINRADLDGGQGVIVLPVMDNRIILVRIYRHATRSWHLEIPRGFGNPGTPANDQAKSEISEEIGGKISELVPLGSVHSNTGIEGNKITVFLAKLSSLGNPELEEGIAKINMFSLPEVEHKIATSQITDAFTITAVYRARLNNLL